jgi:AbrB family looped-hinge helix DNA binding protein
MIATVTSKGQLTLPVAARRKLGIRPGSKLEIIVRGDTRLEVIPLVDSVSSLRGMLGKAPKRLSVKAMNDAIARGASA